eukprot:scaffold20880_cov174-Amphora_coffeaeformis.AAC.7
MVSASPTVYGRVRLLDFRCHRVSAGVRRKRVGGRRMPRVLVVPEILFSASIRLLHTPDIGKS